VAGDERWTENATEALVFGSSVMALEYMTGRRLHAVQIVLKFEEEQFDVKVSKSEGC
jgi:hypothetical protein